MNYVLTSTNYTVQCVQYHNNYSQELGHLCRHPDLAPGGHGGPLVQLAPAHTHTLSQNVYNSTNSKGCFLVLSFALVRCYVERRQNVRVNFRASKHFFVLVRKPVTGRQVKHKASSCPTPWLRGMGGAGEGSTRDYILCVKRKGKGTDELIQ